MTTRRMEGFQKRTRGYVALPNSVTEDHRLSFKALGVLTYLLSRPDDWRPNYMQLMSTHTDGEHSVRAALTELEEAGYYKREKVRHPDGTFGWLTTVFEVPGAWNPGAGESASVESPDLDSPVLGNPGLVPPGSTNDGEPMTENPREEEAYASPSPGLRSVRRPNPVWDSLNGHFGAPMTAPERARRGKTTKELVEVGATPEEIDAAVKRHKRIWPKVTCTERSIVAHWTELTKVDPVDAERAAHHARMKKAREETK